MKLRILGASGAEFPGSRLPAFLIDDVLLLDAGTIGSALTAKEQWKIRDILLTHAHLDHIKGIPFLADNIVITDKNHTVNIYSISPVLRSLKQSLLNWKVWPDFTVIPDPENAVLKLQTIRARKSFTINSYKVTAYRVKHTVPAVGYLLEDGAGSSLLYTGDMGPTSKIWHAVNTSVRCAIVEVSFPNSMEYMAILAGHLTPNLLKEELKHMKSLPERILVTHPKPQHRRIIKQELRKLGIKNIKVVSDDEEYNI
jgi:cAMP phosphodiesterase